MSGEGERRQAITRWEAARGRALFPLPYASTRWRAADTHLILAAGGVLLFTAQRLTGYMGLWLYQRLAYHHLVLAAHVVGGAGLVVVLTLGARPTPMRGRTLPGLHVVANHGWSVGSFLVVWLWWMCWPALRPAGLAGWIAAAAAGAGLMLATLRRIEAWVARRPRAEAWRVGVPVVLWQAYSLHWELALNFLKDDVTARRGAVQWEQIAADLAGTALGLAWARWAARR
ncbi:hypothetical protein [Oleiharenicola sp. Vm1]|uniref:hypothetical protein n=1 Tax=Oleiharenicola sp. Vm1 TaxID=3398393 RepID=UPI0039F5DA81